MKKNFVCLICAITAIVGLSFVTYAATGGGFNSKGTISFVGSDGTNGTTDDIVFDASDLNTIYDEVSAGKQLLADQIINKGADIDKAGDTYTFNELKDGITNVYDQGVSDTTAQVDASKVLAGQTVLGVTGTATSDANATADNLASGTTAYVNGVKLTGTGKDITDSYNAGKEEGQQEVVANPKSFGIFEGAIYLGSYTGGATYYLTDYDIAPDMYRSLTTSNFIVGAGNWSQHAACNGEGNASAQQTINVTYDAQHGILSCSTSASVSKDENGGGTTTKYGSPPSYVFIVP